MIDEDVIRCRWEMVGRTLDERRRRILAAAEVCAAGWAGPISSTTATRSVSGRPRQFCVMWQNRRCSILFHFEVPADSGGRGA
jgi:hypothetical protein